MAGGVTVGDIACGAVIAHQAADVAAAMYVAGCIAIDNVECKSIMSDQSADIGTGAGDVTSCVVQAAERAAIGITDQAANRTSSRNGALGMAGTEIHGVFETKQSADIALSGHLAGGIVVTGTAHRRRADQGTHRIMSGYGNIDQAQVVDDGSLRDTEQTDIIGTGTVDGQVGNAVTQAVEATAEIAAGVPDRHEARTAPDITAIAGGRGIDAAGQGVVRAGRHRHQLQLVRVVDVDRILRGEHRVSRASRVAGIVQSSIGVDHDPVVAGCARRGGESKAAEIRSALHRRCIQAGRTGGCAAAYPGGIDIGVPVAVVDCAGVEPNQPADIAGTAHAADGVAGADRARAVIDPDQSADLVGASCYVAGGVAVADRAIVGPHQPAGVLDPACHIARGVAVADRAPVSPHQTADREAAA